MSIKVVVLKLSSKILQHIQSRKWTAPWRRVTSCRLGDTTRRLGDASDATRHRVPHDTAHCVASCASVSRPTRHHVDAPWRPVPSLFTIYVLLSTELAKVVNIKVVALEVIFPIPLEFHYLKLRSSRYEQNTTNYPLKGLYHFISSKITLNC